MQFIRNILLLVMLTCSIISCADSGDPILNETKGWSVQKLYQTASDALSNGSYDRAIKLYNALETTYPYGVYAQQGLLDLAYAYYENDKPELALVTIDQFIMTYPTNTSMDYALYLKGYINFLPDDGFFAKLTKQDQSQLETKGLQEAYRAFYDLVNKYPSSKYVPDARLKINKIVNDLALSELYKARYYMGIKAYIAAINRSQIIITTYMDTQQVEEAIAIEVSAYKQLGQAKLSEDTKKVLAVNFPKSKYLRHDWKYNNGSWYSLF